ncbi:MAG TPA: N-acetylmuramoyl-L-alanine amidase [Rhizomicrobium sp.]|jgi:N-acetylmuramoyl-L-alanine amidase
MPAGRGSPDPIVMAARIGEHGEGTRLVLESSDPLRVRTFTLVDPDRIVIEMPEVQWRIGAAERPSGHGAIKSYQYGTFRPGDSRLVIGLNRPVAVDRPLLLRPQSGYGYRTVLDFRPTTQQQFQRTSGWPLNLVPGRRLARSAGTGEYPADGPLQARRVIVIDAGHGGIDSGTRGFDGEMEKVIALDEADRLEKLLERRGFVVRLTRDSDVYVPLRQRANAARSWHADLFLSLHADSNPDPRVSGASVYTLSQASSDREAAALARKENQSDAVAGVNLSDESSPVTSILIDLAQRDAMNRSARFAQDLVGRLENATNVLARTPHRSAGFVVLHTPGVPAVLIELGYLSNRDDCARMATGRWRDKVATAIADAVGQQFGPVVPDTRRMQAAD